MQMQHALINPNWRETISEKRKEISSNNKQIKIKMSGDLVRIIQNEEWKTHTLSLKNNNNNSKIK